jgi:MSHA biogenesis protein MshO
MRWHKPRQTGFTLVELIMVIVITGIIGGMVAMFIKAPVDQYIDIARHAEMTDIADTALRRMGRDIGTAVPNSIRLSGTRYIEFLPTKTGGRYRANSSGGSLCSAIANNTDGDTLSFTAADSCFEIIGPAITFVANDFIVVGSIQTNGNLPYDQTATGVLRAYTGGAGSKAIVVMTATLFPTFASLPRQRFEVVPGDQQAVTYACENVGGTIDGTGTLRRYWGYGFNAAQVAPPTGGSSALLADKISACSIAYNTVNQRNGLIAISLTIMRASDSISLYQEIHVNNAP